MRLYFFFFIFLIPLNQALPNDREKLGKIIKLIKKEERVLLEAIKRKDSPVLRWKLINLYQEKFEIVNKLENKSYLAADAKLVRKKGKAYFFRRSRRTYKNIKKIGTFVVKKWPNFEGNARIYYTLASAALDSNDQEDIKQRAGIFLEKGLSKAKRGSKIHTNTTIKLGDYYYDQKKYKKAKKHYLYAIKIKKNKWKTKHLFNLAWCMLKLGQDRAGKNYLKKSWRLSVQSKKKGHGYIDYTDHVFQYFPYFLDHKDFSFVQSMWSHSGKKKDEYLLKVGGLFKEVGKYKESEYFFKKALAKAEKGRDPNKIFEVNLILMDMYIELKMDKKFFIFLKNWIKKYENTPITKKQRGIVAKRIRVYIGIIQSRKVESQFHFVIKSFNFLKKLIPSKKTFYLYLQGEAFFDKQKYKKALAYYKKALMGIQGENIKKQRKLAKMIFDSMIKSIEKGLFEEREKESWNIYIYNKHLNMYPINERSRLIYRRLYNIYRKKNNYKKCEKVFKKYVALYPSLNEKGDKVNKKDAKNHRFMLADILDHYISKGKLQQAKYWISFAKKGNMDIDTGYLKKAEFLFGSKQLEIIKKEKNASVQNLKLKKLYDNKKNHPILRADAAYYIGRNIFNQMQTKQSFIWLRKAFVLSSKKVKNDWDKDILEFVLKTALLGDFSTAKSMALLYFDSRCRDSYDLKNDFYNALIQYSLLSILDGDLRDEELSDVFGYFDKGALCKIKSSVQRENMKGMISFFLNYGDRKSLEKLKVEYGHRQKWRDLFIRGFLGIYWEAVIAGRTESEEYYFKHLEEYFQKKRGVNRELRSIMRFKKFRRKLDREDLYTFVLHEPKEKFDENIFNKNLEKFIKIMDVFKAEVSQYIETGYPQIVYYGYDVLSRRYKALGKSILDFRPIEVEKHYEQAFIKAMKEVGDQFIAESKRVENKLKGLVARKEILYPPKEETHKYNFYLEIGLKNDNNTNSQ